MNEHRYDVTLIGGAFSGSATATLLKRWLPERRILVIEKAEAFDRKVGEATVEISALMLYRVLGLHDYLNREQLPKHGLRYWFTDSDALGLAEMSEIGPKEVPRLPAFQLNRAKLDEEVLATAQRAGVEVLRPAKVAATALGWPESRLTVEVEGESEPREIVTRWVVDASGRNAVLARRYGLHQRTEEHPTAAVWGRFTNVKDLDGIEVLGDDPRDPKLRPVASARRLATNHFCGYGWWCWMIPLSSGETSVGLVYNKELFSLPPGESLEGRFEAHVRNHPGLRELLADAELDREDFRSYAHLPYCTRQYADFGWALVGDAASFIDPYYSPGLDHASISGYATARLIEEDLTGRLDQAGLGSALKLHNEMFLRSYQRWLNGLYVGKYEILGDAELTAASFLMDTAMYYMGIVTPVYENVEALRTPIFSEDILPTKIAYTWMRFYNQRLVALARKRRELGLYGQRNAGWHHFVKTATLGRTGGMPMFRSGLKLWLRAERETFLARFFGRQPKRPAMAPKAMPRPAEA
jgi:flavin-dependent dehydrogenase